MINLTLKQLRYFEALARHGHFGRAAEACAISQPALSMQIKELEDILGAALFERAFGATAISFLNRPSGEEWAVLLSRTTPTAPIDSLSRPSAR